MRITISKTVWTIWQVESQLHTQEINRQTEKEMSPSDIEISAFGLSPRPEA
jgi:hypothetical protein